MAINYTGVDLDRYNAGNKFYSQDRYLQGTGLNKAPITFNQSNTGIMGAYNPYVPIIPEDGGDGGGGIDPKGPNKNFDEYETDAYGVKNLTPEEKGITQEQQDLLNQIRFGTPMTKTQKLGLIGDPVIGGFTALIRNLWSRKTGMDKLTANALRENINSGRAGDYDAGDGWTQTNSGDGTATWSDDRGNKHSGWSNDAAGIAAATAAEGSEGSVSTTDTTSPTGDDTSGTPFAYGGRAGYADGGYSSQDNEEQQAQDQASFDAGNRSDDYNDMYSDNDVPTFSPQSGPTNYSNFDFGLRNNADVVANWNTKYGRLSGILDTDETIKGGSPKGSLSYNGSIGPGNFNATYNLGDRGPTLGYTGNINPNTTFGANYNPDGTYGMGINFNKKFNNGGIVGLYR
tara:strand:+ start:32 stop:1231 length:1200 start_codon:yes stop_codon:yes gene_type:complete